MRLTQKEISEIAIDLQNASIIEHMETDPNKVTIGKAVGVLYKSVNNYQLDEILENKTLIFAILGRWDWHIRREINGLSISPLDCPLAQEILDKEAGYKTRIKSHSGHIADVEVLSISSVF